MRQRPTDCKSDLTNETKWHFENSAWKAKSSNQSPSLENIHQYTWLSPSCLTDLVGIFQDEVFAGREGKAGVNDGMEHPPGIGNVKGHLLGEFCWLDLLYSQDLVFGGVTMVDPRDVAREREGLG